MHMKVSVFIRLIFNNFINIYIFFYIVHRGLAPDPYTGVRRIQLFWFSYDGLINKSPIKVNEEQLSPLAATGYLTSPWKELVQMSLAPSR